MLCMGSGSLFMYNSLGTTTDTYLQLINASRINSIYGNFKKEEHPDDWDEPDSNVTVQPNAIQSLIIIKFWIDGGWTVVVAPAYILFQRLAIKTVLWYEVKCTLVVADA